MGNPKLSADGRWLAFDSTASNLVSDDHNDMSDVFLYEVATGTLTRISKALGGVESGGASFMPYLNANGRFVVFESTATDLTFDDNNAASDVFLYDRELGTTRCLSITGIPGTGNILGATANGASSRPVISADGYFIAYQSEASNLVAADGNGSDIFVFDRRSSKNAKVSLGPGGIAANGASYNPSISADGRIVVFTSVATNLVSGNGDSNGKADVFAYDRQAASITRVSLTASGGQAEWGPSASTRESISADGRYILFASDSRDMATGNTVGDDNDATDVYVRDQVAGTTRRVSLDGAGNQANAASPPLPSSPSSPTPMSTAEGKLALSADGRMILFLTASNNILPYDGNGTTDLALTPNSLEACPPPVLLAMAQDVIRAQTAVDICAHSLDPDPAHDGITFASRTSAVSAVTQYHLASTAPANVTAGLLSVQVASASPSNSLQYLLTPLRANLGTGSVWANADATGPSASADGQRIVFTSAATNLLGGHTPSATDVFMFDRWANSQVRVNRSTGGAYPTTGLSSSSGRISADGRFVAYDSLGANLVANDSNGQSDVFVFDLQTNNTIRVSVATFTGAEATGGGSYGPAISRDGRFIAFYSDANNLVANDNNTAQDVFVRDRVRQTTVLVSQASNGSPGNAYSREPAISANGRYLAFRAAASSLVTGDANGVDDIFLRDVDLSTTVLVSVSSAGVQSDKDSRSAALSANGRYVVFESDGTNLVDGDTNGTTDIFLRDTEGSTTTRISVASDGGNANGISTKPSISADGRFITYQSSANNIVAGDTENMIDVFVYDRQTGTTSRISTTADSHTGGNDTSQTPFITPEGRFVVFASRAQNLATGDTGSFFDVFLTARNP
jgi:Tol biopolymer transport system component